MQFRAASRGVGVVAVGGLLAAGYLRMSRSIPADADGSSNALQAWDMLHGNVLLHGWTVTDVSFYTTELVQYAILELLFGLRVDTQHVASALTFALLVLLAAAVARGRARGVEAFARIAVAVCVMLVPAPGAGYHTLLVSPNHTGTAVPLLLTWLVLDRATNGGSRSPGWRLSLGIAALLVWAQVGDPLALFVGAVPLIVVSGWRMWRDGEARRAGNAGLLAAGVLSILGAYLVHVVVWWAGGFSAHPAGADFASADRLSFNANLLSDSLTINFGAYLPDAVNQIDLGLRLLNLLGLAAVATALGVGTGRMLRRRPGLDGDRVADVLTVAIVTNVAAFALSTIPFDWASSRHLAVVLPFGAALAGRTLAPLLTRSADTTSTRPSKPAIALAAVLMLFGAGLMVRVVSARPVPHEAKLLGDWLMSRHESFGLGDYWAANITTVHTHTRVQVAPIVAGPNRIYAYRWEVRNDWYDATKHDARFIIVDLTWNNDVAAEAHFGEPVERQDFGRFAVLRYDHNLLVGLPAYCVPEVATTITGCPDLPPRPPGPTGWFG